MKSSLCQKRPMTCILNLEGAEQRSKQSGTISWTNTLNNIQRNTPSSHGASLARFPMIGKRVCRCTNPRTLRKLLESCRKSSWQRSRPFCQSSWVDRQIWRAVIWPGWRVQWIFNRRARDWGIMLGRIFATVCVNMEWVLLPMDWRHMVVSFL